MATEGSPTDGLPQPATSLEEIRSPQQQQQQQQAQSPQPGDNHQSTATITSYPYEEDARYSAAAQRERIKSIDERHLNQMIGARYMYHKGAVRTAFSQPEDFGLLDRFWRTLNKIGTSRSERSSSFVFHRKSHFRKSVKKVVKSRFFKLFMALVTILNALSLCFYQPAVKGDIHQLNQIIAYITVIFIFIYIIEAMLTILAYTLILYPKSYLRSYLHLLDLVVIVCGILYVSLINTLPELAEVFASLMALKLIKILMMSKDVRFIVKALAKSVSPLFYLSIFTVAVIFFFSLVGVQLFAGELHGGCYANYTTPAGKLQAVLVSPFPCDTNKSIGISSFGSHRCPNGSYCDTWEMGPNHGITSFDNIFRAFLTVFQLITLEGWTGVFYLYESALGYSWVWVFFILVVLFGSIFVLNLWIGVLTSVFIGVSDREETHSNIRKLKEQMRIEEDLKNYKVWLKKGAELDQPCDTGSIGRRPSFGITTPWVGVAEGGVFNREDLSSEEEEDDELESLSRDDVEETRTPRMKMYRWFKKSRRVVRKIVHTRAFFFLDIVIHVVNVILLMSLHFPSSEAFNGAMYGINYIFTVWYILESFLYLYGVGIQHYLVKIHLPKLAVLVLAIISIIVLVAFVPVSTLRDVHLSVFINAVWSIKLIHFFRYSTYWSQVKEILDTVVQLFGLTISLLLLIALFLFFFTISGLRLFGLRLSEREHVQPNFDNLWNSFLIVFQLLTTEDWHNVLYDSVGPWLDELGTAVGTFVTFYHMLAILLGSFILVSIFLSIAVDKLSEVRSLEDETSQQSETRQKKRKEREEQIFALKNPEEPQVRRRTIRRVLKFISDSPAERAKVVQGQKMGWWRRQSSLPTEKINTRPSSLLIKDRQGATTAVRRSSSVPADASASVSNTPDDVNVSRRGNKVTFEKPRQRNPLRWVQRQRSTYYDKQRLRLRAAATTATDSATTTAVGHSHQLSTQSSEMSGYESSSSAHSHPRVISLEGQDSVFELPEIAPPTVNVRSTSIVSSPDATLLSGKPAYPMPLSLSYERTQSCPSSDLSTPKNFNDLPKLDVIEESNGGLMERDSNEEEMESENDVELESGSGEDTPHVSSNGGSEHGVGGSGGRNSRLARQSSLEIITDEIDAHIQPGLSPSLLVPPRDAILNSSLESIKPVSSYVDLSRRASIAAVSYKQEFKKKTGELWRWMKDYVGTIQFDPKSELKEIPAHSAFFIWSPENRFREFCFRILSYQSFQTVSMAAVFLSSLFLTLEIPIGVEESRANEALCALQRTIVALDAIVIAFFVVEMLMKMVALGVIFHRGSYFRGFFNMIDFIVVVTSLIPLVYYGVISNNPNPLQDQICIAYSYDVRLPIGIRALRAIRVLRPLRAIRVAGLYHVVTGLLYSAKSILFIFFFSCLVLNIFGIFGVQFFRGRFSYCTDPTVTTERSCNGSFFIYDYTYGETLPPGLLECPKVEEREWKTHGLNFDNIGNAALTLFAMLTSEGWQNVMYNGINSVSPLDSRTSRGPQTGNTQHAGVYFVLYMLIVTFVFVNMFVGFVIVTFQEVGVKAFRETKLDRNQRNCLYYALTAKPFHQYIPKYKFHQKIHDKLTPLIEHYISKFIICVLLFFNCVVLAAKGTHDKKDIAYHINIFFTAFFSFEAVFKILVLTPPIYFRNIWNLFEFLIELGAVLELIVQTSSAAPYENSSIASTFRVLRLLRYIPQVRLILWTVIKSLEIFPWVGYLLLVVVFMYAVLGMQFYGDIRIAPIDESDQTEITEYNNFANFPQALLVMIRVATGENWPDVMLSCIAGQRCERDPESTCGSDTAYVFFITFFSLSSILILNLFVAIIIDNFDYIVRDRSILGAHQLGLFVKLWSVYDPQATGELFPEDVLDLLRKCNPPVGWGKLCPQTLAHKKMMRLNMPIVDGGKVTFNATLFALVRTTLKIHCQGCPDCIRKCNIDLQDKLKILFPNMANKRITAVLPTDNDYTVGMEYAALLIQAKWRSVVLLRRRVMEIFQGSRGRVLIAGPRAVPDSGPDLNQRRVSDFAAELELPSPRRPSDVSSIDTITSGTRVESPPNNTLMFFDRELTTSPVSSGAVNSPTLSVVDLQSGSTGTSRPSSTVQGVPQETVQEFREESSQPKEGEDKEKISRRLTTCSDTDIQSELSFMSAYSSPLGSVDSLQPAADYSYSTLETTV